MVNPNNVKLKVQRDGATDEREAGLWHKTKFTIEGVEDEFNGWTDGRLWYGWTMPYSEFAEASKVIDVLPDSKGRFDAQRDCFVTTNDAEDEV